MTVEGKIMKTVEQDILSYLKDINYAAPWADEQLLKTIDDLDTHLERIFYIIPNIEVGPQEVVRRLTLIIGEQKPLALLSEYKWIREIAKELSNGDT